MKQFNIFQVAVLSMVFCSLFITDVFAGKVKTSEHYVGRIEKATQPIVQQLEEIQVFIQSMNKTGSFIKSDFWGNKPVWYLDSRMKTPKITTDYPFSEQLIKHYGPWKKNAAYAVRNINGIILTPYERPRKRVDNRWSESLSMKFKMFGGYGDGRNLHKWMLIEFTKAGVPKDKLEQAWEVFTTKIQPAFEIVHDKVFSRFDTLFTGATVNGDYGTYMAIGQYLEKKGQLNVQDFLSPVNHKNIFTENIFEQAGFPMKITSFHEAYTATAGKRAKKISLNDFYVMLDGFWFSIEARAQYFIVARNLDKSQRFNQLRKLKGMLDGKVENDSAVKSMEGQYTVYEDATLGGKYKGRLAVNFESGNGYWQLPVVAGHADVKLMAKALKEKSSLMQKIIKEYHTLCVKETIQQFVQKGAVTDDF